MIKITHTISFLVLILATLSCVSKKKFVDMESQRNQYLEETKNLNREMAQLKKDLSITKTDYSKMKEALLASNAAKNDSLNQVIVRLSTLQQSYKNAESNLAKTKDLIKDQRYYNSKSNGEITRLNIELKQLARDTVSLNYSIKLLQNKAMLGQQKLQERVGQVNQKNLEIIELKELSALNKTEVAKLNAELEAIELKVANINTAFIALRRQLLSAKTAGKPIDPNANPNINTISKSLGHY